MIAPDSQEPDSQEPNTHEDGSACAPPASRRRPRLAIFVSGTGRHLENLARLATLGELDIELVLAVADRAGIAALDRAQKFGLPSIVIDPERELDAQDFSREAFTKVEEAECDLIVLAGFLRKLCLPKHWEGHVLNIHPSLLPSFGGKGYWGEHVHNAVLERGCRISGCTVHYVDDEYDHGPILAQEAVRVMPGDTSSTLAARVFQAELLALPAAIKAHVSLAPALLIPKLPKT